MTYRTLLFAAVAASFAVAANAQEVPSAPPPADDTNTPAAESAASPSAATVGTEFKAGAAVKDSAGADVGVIQGVSDGEAGPQVVLQIDGALYGVPVSTLSNSDGATVSAKTKAEIKAASKPRK